MTNYINPINYIFFIMLGFEAGNWKRAWCVLFHKNHTERRFYTVRTNPDYRNFWQVQYVDSCSKCGTSTIITDHYPLVKEDEGSELLRDSPLSYSYSEAVNFGIERSKKK